MSEQGQMNSVRSTAQLAKTLGLSRWTVSRALNGHPGLNPQTVARIKETARTHGFAPSVLGRGLRSGRTNLVGICLPNIVDYFLTTKIAHLEKALQAQGLHPLLQIMNGEPGVENSALERFASMHCTGVVVIASKLKEADPGFRSLAASKIPVVHIDPLRSKASPSVSTDRHSAMVDALLHLHQLGHRRLVAAGISSETSYGKQRVSGLKAGCRKAGWIFQRDILILPPPAAPDDFAAGVLLAEEFQRTANDFSAILALNDRVASGMMRCLTEAGLHIPKDLSIVGYDNADFSPYATPSLTTIDPKVECLIERAVEMLMAGTSEATALVRPSFIERDSTGPALVFREKNRPASRLSRRN
ncbi:LacI family DNA-binding transcriptional regulator [soil metagenome]